MSGHSFTQHLLSALAPANAAMQAIAPSRGNSKHQDVHHPYCLYSWSQSCKHHTEASPVDPTHSTLPPTSASCTGKQGLIRPAAACRPGERKKSTRKPQRSGSKSNNESNQHIKPDCRPNGTGSSLGRLGRVDWARPTGTGRLGRADSVRQVCLSPWLWITVT